MSIDICSWVVCVRWSFLQRLGAKSKLRRKKETRKGNLFSGCWVLALSVNHCVFLSLFFRFLVVRKGTQNPVLLSFYMAIKAHPIATLQRVTEQSISRVSLLTYWFMIYETAVFNFIYQARKQVICTKFDYLLYNAMIRLQLEHHIYGPTCWALHRHTCGQWLCSWRGLLNALH